MNKKKKRKLEEAAKTSKTHELALEKAGALPPVFRFIKTEIIKLDSGITVLMYRYNCVDKTGRHILAENLGMPRDAYEVINGGKTDLTAEHLFELTGATVNLIAAGYGIGIDLAIKIGDCLLAFHCEHIKKELGVEDAQQ